MFGLATYQKPFNFYSSCWARGEAFKLSTLSEFVENLPGKYMVISDLAYVPTEYMISLFFGTIAKEKQRTTSNVLHCNNKLELK